MFRNLKKLMDLGVKETLKVEEAQRVRLTNILGFIPMLMYVAYFVFGLLNQYYFPVFLCGFLLIVASFGIYLNAKGFYGQAKFVLFSINSISIFIAYNCLNIDYSICCYFFPLLMAFEILYDVKNEFKPFLSALIFSALCVAACFVLPKGLFYYFEMADDLLESSKLMNYLLPFGIGLFFMLVIMKMHAETQDKLIASKEEAEQAYKAKSQFLSNMSHELRTPLNGIIGSANLLMHEGINQSQKRFFDIISHSSNHMLSLVNDILDYSKIEAGKLELDENTFNLQELVRRVSDMFGGQFQQKGVDFITEIDEALNINVVSDDLRLSQILHNLLSNAFKFTRKGSVTLKVTREKQTDDNVFIHFSVADTGVGIKDEAQRLIFESFTQAETGTSRQFGGTGLGLSISQQLIHKFNSKIHLDSTYGKGSTFSFTLALQKAGDKVTETETPVLASDEFMKGIKVLVAEDNRINMMIIRKFLLQWNADVTEASNGADAVQHFKNKDFDLILMDLEMPVMDGHEALSEIRRLDEHVPVLAFTAALYDNMESDLKGKGFSDFVLKPFNPGELLNKMRPYTRA
jgi:signal transduction histidine kinase/CheY-like chemotaxis protein